MTKTGTLIIVSSSSICLSYIKFAFQTCFDNPSQQWDNLENIFFCILLFMVFLVVYVIVMNFFPM